VAEIDVQVQTTLAKLVMVLGGIIPEIRVKLIKVGVQALADPALLVQLPSGNDGLIAYVIVIHIYSMASESRSLP
jgi:hypothetical protein